MRSITASLVSVSGRSISRESAESRRTSNRLEGSVHDPGHGFAEFPPVGVPPRIRLLPLRILVAGGRA